MSQETKVNFTFQKWIEMLIENANSSVYLSSYAKFVIDGLSLATLLLETFLSGLSF